MRGARADESRATKSKNGAVARRYEIFGEANAGPVLLSAWAKSQKGGAGGAIMGQAVSHRACPRGRNPHFSAMGGRFVEVSAGGLWREPGMWLSAFFLGFGAFLRVFNGGLGLFGLRFNLR